MLIQCAVVFTDTGLFVCCTAYMNLSETHDEGRLDISQLSCLQQQLLQEIAVQLRT